MPDFHLNIFQSIGPSIRSGPGFCPRINKTSEGSTEILVPSGVSRRISVKVDNIQVSNVCRDFFYFF